MWRLCLLWRWARQSQQQAILSLWGHITYWCCKNISGCTSVQPVQRSVWYRRGQIQPLLSPPLPSPSGRRTHRPRPCRAGKQPRRCGVESAAAPPALAPCAAPLSGTVRFTGPRPVKRRKADGGLAMETSRWRRGRATSESKHPAVQHDVDGACPGRTTQRRSAWQAATLGMRSGSHAG